MSATIGVPLAIFAFCLILLGAVSAFGVHWASRKFGGRGAASLYALLTLAATAIAMWRIRASQAAIDTPLDQRDAIPVMPIFLALFAATIGAAALVAWRRRAHASVLAVASQGAGAALLGAFGFVVFFVLLDISGALR